MRRECIKLPCSIFTRTKSKQNKWSIDVISRIKHPSPHFSALIDFKIIYMTFWVTNNCHRQSVASLSLNYPYINGKCSDDIYSYFLPVHCFTARSRYGIYTRSTHTHALLNALIKRKTFINDSLQERLLYRRDSQVNPSKITMVLTSSGMNSYISNTLA